MQKKSYESKYHDGIGLSVYKSGLERCEPSHSWGPGLKDHFLIHVVSSGKGIYINAGQRYHLQKGDVFLIYPSQLVEYCADFNEPWEYYWVGFNGSDAAGLVDACGFSKEKPVFKCDNLEANIASLMKIYESSGPSKKQSTEMVGYLYLFLAGLIDRDYKPAAYGGRAYAEQALRFIDHNYSRNISVSEISKELGLSRSHLYRVFAEYTGQTPSEYLMRYRVEKAASLMIERGLTVSEAAYSAGFSDPSYFSRIFKKIMKIPPKEFLSKAAAERV